jgi:hypothetical protein
MSIRAAIVLGCLPFTVFAAGMNDELQFRELPPEPTPAPGDEDEAPQSEPEITIIQREDATIVEYRINGYLRAVRIIPVSGKPYYLVDTNGDGQFDVRTDDLADNMLVPRWVIYSW